MPGANRLPPASFKVIEPDKPAAASPGAPPGKIEKPVGRQPVIWQQSARSDFGNGKFTGTGVSVTGELRLSAVLNRFTTSPETYIWSLISDNLGNLYAGTGTSGRVYKIDPMGHAILFAELPVEAVQTLLLAHDGTLWAGTGAEMAPYTTLLIGRQGNSGVQS